MASLDTGHPIESLARLPVDLFDELILHIQARQEASAKQASKGRPKSGRKR